MFFLGVPCLQTFPSIGLAVHQVPRWSRKIFGAKELEVKYFGIRTCATNDSPVDESHLLSAIPDMD